MNSMTLWKQFNQARMFPAKPAFLCAAEEVLKQHQLHRSASIVEE